MKVKDRRQKNHISVICRVFFHLGKILDGLEQKNIYLIIFSV